MPAPRTPADMLQIMMAKLEPRTGRSFAQWVELAAGLGISGHRALTEALKTQHGLNHNEAQWVAWGVVDPDRITAYDRPADLVADLYSGKRAALRPLYEALMAAGHSIDPDVSHMVCKTYTSLSRRVQFAVIVPRNQTSIDVELALPAEQEGGRAQALKSTNPRFGIRIRLGAEDPVDADLQMWLRRAWELGGA
jgi:Domain of unknown function (DUF5655)/Domain of unknown function (DUF4287)